MSLIEDILDLEIPNNVKISPNGQRVVYTTSTTAQTKGKEGPTSTLWLAETGCENSFRKITSGKYHDSSPQWHPDSNAIAFTSDREQPGQKWAIYTLPLTVGGEPYALTPADNERNITAHAFSPDGKFLAYISADEKTPEKKQREKDKDDVNVWEEDLPFARLRLLHIATKKITTLFSENANVTKLAWSPHGTRIAFVHTKSTRIDSGFVYGDEIAVVHIGDKKVEKILNFKHWVNNLTWASGNTLHFIGAYDLKRFSTSQVVYSLDLDAEKPWPKRVAHGVEDCAGDIIKAGNDIVVNSNVGLGNRVYVLGGKTIGSFESMISAYDAVFTSDSDEMILAVAKADFTGPCEVYSKTASGGAMIQLSDHGATLAGHDFGEATPLSCQTDDGKWRLDSVFFSPPKSKRKQGPFPTAVVIHGGPYWRSSFLFNPGTVMWPAVLTASGYGVLLPNYRGNSGRGDEFAKFASGQVGTVDYDDIITLTQNAIDKGYADKERLLVSGWSQGGLLSYLSSTRNGLHGRGWRFRASIPGAGISDFDTMAYTSDVGDSAQADFIQVASWNASKNDTSGRIASAIWEVKAAVEKGNVIPPMLILHGEKDERVPFEQGVAMRRALKAHGLPVEFVSYPRMPHMPFERYHYKDLLERVVRWADTYISSQD